MTVPEQYSTRDPAAGAGPADAVQLEQPFTANDLYTLRAGVSAHADSAGLPQTTIDALLIVTGELASNVVQHGGGAGRLALWCTAQDVIVQVSDDGPGMADPDDAGRTPVPTNAPSGRGLWMVRQLSRDVRIDTGAQGTTVTATMPADSEA